MRKSIKSPVLKLAGIMFIMTALLLLVRVQEAKASGDTYTVQVDAGYLALRSSPAYTANNEIGRLYNGDVVEVQDYGGTYWYVYSPKYNRYGYVNNNYLSYSGSSSDGTRYDVSVSSGYLALRSAKAYDSRNEIGQLYNGDYVLVQDTSEGKYWWVYSPKYDKYGYVNHNYLKGAGGSSYTDGTAYTVSVSDGYLALRSARAYDSSNEIGRLYNGETVYLQDSSYGKYWWVYSPKYDKCGYVNHNYLYRDGDYSYTMTVGVDSGYLALRNARAYDSSNEIGRLYNGDTVQVMDDSGSTYWYVYSPKHDLYGYVNRNYLY